MRRFLVFLAGVAVGALGMFGSLKFHIVRARDGVHPVPKTIATLSDTYVDIREFDLGDWDEHPELAIAISASDKAYLMQDAARKSLQDAVLDAFDGFEANRSSP